MSWRSPYLAFEGGTGGALTEFSAAPMVTRNWQPLVGKLFVPCPRAAPLEIRRG